MGVDSNVLIFERIREELRAGKPPASAVDLGFKRAFLTIIDTHVTTVVSAIFPFCVRHRPGPRFRRHPDHRVGGQPVYGRLRISRDIRLALGQDAASAGFKYLNACNYTGRALMQARTVSNLEEQGSKGY